MYSWVFFDWDGCIADTLRIWIRAYARILPNYGINASTQDIWEKLQLGNVPQQYAVSNHMQCRTDTRKVAMALFEEVSLYSNAKDALTTIAGQCALGIVSNSPGELLHPVLGRYEINDLFSSIIAKEDMAEPKPHPEGILKTMELLHAEPEKTLFVGDSDTEIVALRLLDFLSSKQGYIRRKGLSFRTVSFYRFAVPKLTQQVRRGLPIELNSLCLCTTLANMRYAGESPYPHMGAFIAFENLHKIILGSRAIYQPGVRMTLGYEGALFEPLYFQAKGVVQQSLQILQQLNDYAARNIWSNGENPIKIVDALWMIERSFGSAEYFTKRVEELMPVLPEDESSQAWCEWYNQTVSDYFFPSKAEREQFVEERARWRRAILYLKYNEGINGHGFMDYGDNAMTFTPSGRRQNMLALQLIPENSHLPHQRVITYDSAEDKWRTMAFKTVVDDDDTYAPRYAADYSYPFYYEKVAQ